MKHGEFRSGGEGEVVVIDALDTMLARREMTGKQLAHAVGLSETQMSLFRSGKVRGIRFATLARICEELKCQPGDLLGLVPD